MLSGKRSWRRSAVLVIAVIQSVVLAACSSSAKSNSGSAPNSGSTSALPAGADQGVFALLPASIKAKGKIVVASIPDYPPAAFLPEGGTELEGRDIDLAKALAKVMGLRIDIKNVAFAALIPGLLAGKYNIGLAAIGITAEREKTLDMIEYVRSGYTGFMVETDSSLHLDAWSDLCGLKVAVLLGSIASTDTKTTSSECTKAGKPTISIQTYETQDVSTLAVLSHRAEVTVGGYDGLSYAAQLKKGELTVTGVKSLAGSKVGGGITLTKGNPLVPAVQKALSTIIANGTYGQILDKWHVSKDAVTAPRLNPDVD